jgi:predicted transcriptional regulator
MNQNKKEWFNKLRRDGKIRDPTEDHRLGLMTLQNKKRREILNMLVEGELSLSEITQRLGVSEGEAKFHISMLEQALFVEEKEGKIYSLTVRGEEYLKNVKNVKK